MPAGTEVLWISSEPCGGDPAKWWRNHQRLISELWDARCGLGLSARGSPAAALVPTRKTAGEKWALLVWLLLGRAVWGMFPSKAEQRAQGKGEETLLKVLSVSTGPKNLPAGEKKMAGKFARQEGTKLAKRNDLCKVLRGEAAWKGGSQLQMCERRVQDNSAGIQLKWAAFHRCTRSVPRQLLFRHSVLTLKKKIISSYLCFPHPDSSRCFVLFTLKTWL